MLIYNLGVNSCRSDWCVLCTAECSGRKLCNLFIRQVCYSTVSWIMDSDSTHLEVTWNQFKCRLAIEVITCPSLWSRFNQTFHLIVGLQINNTHTHSFHLKCFSRRLLRRLQVKQQVVVLCFLWDTWGRRTIPLAAGVLVIRPRKNNEITFFTAATRVTQRRLHSPSCH